MKNQIILFFAMFMSLHGFSQVQGYVKDNAGNSIPGAHIRWCHGNTATTTDIDGFFKISQSSESNMLVVSSVGYANDTITISENESTNKIQITLNDNVELSEVTVTQQRLGKIKSRTSVFNIESLNTHELRKAACCNLSESFETNPSVDVSFSDAATGAKQIRLLGLSGGYVQMLTENIPNLRGMSSAYGMGYIPGPWMESIQISKGTASVKNGYEAIAGQINVEYKKPHNSDKLSLNLYTNSTGRIEGNADAAVKLNENLSTSILLHASDELFMLDQDNDGYLDLPRVKQYNVANRWHYTKDNYILQAFIRGLSEKRIGGQTKDNYKIGVNSERYEFFVKNGFMFGDSEEHNHEHDHEGEEHDHENEPHKNQSSLGIIVSGSIHKQNAHYGIKNYNGQQKNIYLNLIYDTELGKYQKISTGTSFNLDMYNEIASIVIPNSNRTENVPGVFAEYTLTYKDLTALAGIRADYHSNFGMFISPRFHVRYNLMNRAHLRVSAGKGYRSPQVMAENNFLLASNRNLTIANNLKAEEAWNFGATAHLFIPIWNGKELGFMTEFYHTNFLNQLVVDMDSNPHGVGFYNSNGKSYSSSLQFEANLELFRGMTATLAHRINDVKMTIGGELREKPLTNRTKSMISLSYQTPLNKWQFDFTTQFNGGGRLPDPDKMNPLWEKEFAPFTIMNTQITKNFKTWSVYGGVENLTGFMQEHPIIDVQNPFGDNFDASMVWGPMHGRTIYLGFRWALSKS